MFDFKASFQKGMSAAKTAASNKEEINEVVSDLSSQVQDSTDGKIEIFITSRSEDIPFEAILNRNFKVKSWQVIAAKNNITENELVLAKWELDRNGYPVMIDLDGNATFAEDKEGLQASLADLLADPRIGDILLRLLKDK